MREKPRGHDTIIVMPFWLKHSSHFKFVAKVLQTPPCDRTTWLAGAASIEQALRRSPLQGNVGRRLETTATMLKDDADGADETLLVSRMLVERRKAPPRGGGAGVE